MRTLIVTVAGTATRFNRDTEKEVLKCLYYKERPEYTLLYQILAKSDGIDEYIVVGGGLFGVRMGYYFALGKYRSRKRYLPLAFFSPYLAHALYNYFLLKREPVFWLFFSVLEARLWVFGLKRIKELQNCSPFREKVSKES